MSSGFSSSDQDPIGEDYVTLAALAVLAIALVLGPFLWRLLLVR